MYINFEVFTRKTLRIQNDLSLVPPISGRMYARSPIWSWGGAAGYWGGAKSRSSSPPQPPTTPESGFRRPPTHRLDLAWNAESLCGESAGRPNLNLIVLEFYVFFAPPQRSHPPRANQVNPASKKYKFEILKFNRDSPDFFACLGLPECWLSLHWKLVFPWFFGLGKRKKIQNLTFATQSGAAPVM